MKTLLTTAVLVLLSFTLTNCSSSDDTPAGNTTATLTTGEWKLSEFKIGQEDQISTLNACELRETFTFNANGTFTNNVYTINTDGTCDLTTHTGTFTDITDNTGLRYNLIFENSSRDTINMRLAKLEVLISHAFDVTDPITRQVSSHSFNFTK